METRILECRKILDKFLQDWPYERVVQMDLEEYVGLNDRKTFCYAVERDTIKLGSIKGHPSIKFGIYKRGKKEKQPANYISDNAYSWAGHYKVQTREEAFRKVRADILTIIHAASRGDFESIDKVKFNHLMKWKIASLYSRERLLPIFKKEALWAIAKIKGLDKAEDRPFSFIYEYLISRKPMNRNVYQYALELLNSYWNKEVASYYLIGCKYDGNRNMFPLMVEEQVICTGYAWEYDLSFLYQAPEYDIIEELKKLAQPEASYNALKKFLQLKPGDIIAIKSSGNPKAGEPFLEIIGYALVVQRNGKVYYHDDINFGHCINVEFIEIGVSNILSYGGYSRTIHSLTDPENIKAIFGKYRHGNIHSKIKSQRRRYRKGANAKATTAQQRKASRPYVANMVHNNIQQRFFEHLIELHGEDSVLMEENYVDVKLILEDRTIFYEIKPYALPEDCIRTGLGQLLSYVHFDKLATKSEIRIVGPSKADKDDLELIQFLKNTLDMPFEYESFDPE